MGKSTKVSETNVINAIIQYMPHHTEVDNPLLTGENLEQLAEERNKLRALTYLSPVMSLLAIAEQQQGFTGLDALRIAVVAMELQIREDAHGNPHE